MTPDEMYHAGGMWTYQDSAGVGRVGHLHHVTDLGGSDVTYSFRECSSGTLSLVSGRRLMGASATYSHTCETRSRIIAEMSQS